MTKLKVHKKRGGAVLGTAVLIAATLLFTGCPNVNENKPASPKYTVAFSVDGGNGRLTAKTGGITEADKSPVTVEKDKIVTFVATPDSGYQVKDWMLDDQVLNVTNNSYHLKIEKAVTIKVRFEKLPPGKASYTVKHYQEKIEGGYPTEPTQSENQSGTVGANAVYATKTYRGFTYNPNLTKINSSVQTEGTITSGNSTVVEFYYERNTV